MSGGSYYGVVGGKVGVNVASPLGEQLKKIAYAVTGAVESQIYTWAAGTTTRLSSSVVHELPTPNNMDTLLFNWDETTGNHSITVNATYQDGNGVLETAPAVTINVNVAKPIVTTFQDVYSATQLRNYSNAKVPSYGISQGDYYNVPGNKFSATVSTTGIPQNGVFAIIQLTTIDRETNYNNGNNTIVYTQKSSGNILDNDSSGGLFMNDVTYARYVSDSVPPGATAVPIPPSTYATVEGYPEAKGKLVDSPFLGFGIPGNDPMNTGYTKISIHDTFSTYLVYKPDNGIWIALSKITWSIDAVVSKGTTDWGIDMPPPTTLSPSTPGTSNGDGNTSLINWTGCAAPSNPNPAGTPQLPPGVGTFWKVGGNPSSPPPF